MRPKFGFALRKVILRLAFAIGMAFIALNAMPFRIVHGVTAERIRTIRPGMPESELLKLLGQPLERRRWGTDGALLFYARETPLENHSPTLWVQVENGRVRQIEGKRTVMLFDDEGIYLRRDDVAWQSPAFARTFN